MKNLNRFLPLLLILFFLFLGVYVYNVGISRVEILTYYEFKTLLKEGQVDEIIIKKNEITGKFKEGASETLHQIRKKPIKLPQFFKVYRADDPELIKLLESKNINFEVKPDGTFWVNLLSWILPIILLILFWIFLFRRFISPESGIMSVGKSKAKIYVENEIKVTFNDVAGG